jgi:hypothetical protein
MIPLPRPVYTAYGRSARDMKDRGMKAVTSDEQKLEGGKQMLLILTRDF